MKLLIVPQTSRNYRLFKAYLQQAEKEHEIDYLRSNIWDKELDIANGNNLARETILQPELLMCGNKFTNSYKRVIYQITKHAELREIIRAKGFDAVITGVDSDGLGRWMVYIAKQLKIPSIVCQEGNRWNTGQWDDPLIIRLKRFISNTAYCLFFKPGVSQWNKEFQTADYALVWGRYDYAEAVKRGRRKNGLYIIGDPRIKAREVSKTCHPENKTLVVLFLDAPTDAVPHGTFDGAIYDKFRNDLLTAAAKYGIKVLYRLHPLTRDEGYLRAANIIKHYSNVQLVREGVAEDYYSQADVCITFPSTAILGALAYGIPIVFIELKAKGFGKIVWNPVKQHNAGLMADTGTKAIECANQFKKPLLFDRYYQNSIAASEEMVGPLDGHGSVRFSEALSKILNC